MRYRLVCVDRLREPYIAAAVDDFAKRLRRYAALEIVTVPAGRGAEPRSVVRQEGEALLRRIAHWERVWLLDRGGLQLSSTALAERLSVLERDGTPQLTLVIAGAFGASDAVFRRADFVWSLSSLTLLHEWARAIVVEQLYRAAKIASGEPYHH